MNKGEKMIWAATYAAEYVRQLEKRDRSTREYEVSVTQCMETACGAVMEFRASRRKFIEDWGETHQLVLMVEEVVPYLTFPPGSR